MFLNIIKINTDNLKDNHVIAGKLLESLNLLISKLKETIILGEIKAKL